MDNESASPIEANQVWVFTLAIVIVAIIAYGFFYATNTTTSIPFLIGENAVYTLFIAAILTLINGRIKSQVSIRGGFLSVWRA